MVCAGDGTADTCQGDSGGPIMVPRVDAYVLVGVTSKGFGCANPDFPGIYARLGAPALNAWVLDRIPTVRIDSPSFTQWPNVGEDVQLSASGASGLHNPPDPALEWSVSDLDGDCTRPNASRGWPPSRRPRGSGSLPCSTGASASRCAALPVAG